VFNKGYWSAQYFPAVWFAPADDSHLTPEETETRRPRSLGPWRYQEAQVWAGGERLELDVGKVRVESVDASSLDVVVLPRGTQLSLSGSGVRAEGAQRVEVTAAGHTLQLGGVGVEVMAVQVGSTFASGSTLHLGGGLTQTSTGSSVMLVGETISVGEGGVGVKTVQNPTDEEIIMFFQRQRAQQGVSNGRAQNSRFR
jgi:hypothetical protein